MESEETKMLTESYSIIPVPLTRTAEIFMESSIFHRYSTWNVIFPGVAIDSIVKYSRVSFVTSI